MNDRNFLQQLSSRVRSYWIRTDLQRFLRTLDPSELVSVTELTEKMHYLRPAEYPFALTLGRLVQARIARMVYRTTTAEGLVTEYRSFDNPPTEALSPGATAQMLVGRGQALTEAGHWWRDHLEKWHFPSPKQLS